MSPHFVDMGSDLAALGSQADVWLAGGDAHLVVQLPGVPDPIWYSQHAPARASLAPEAGQQETHASLQDPNVQGDGGARAL